MGHFNGKVGNAHALSRDRVLGVIRSHIFVVSDPKLSISLYSFYGATMTIKGSLHGASPIVRRFATESFVPSKACAKWRFW